MLGLMIKRNIKLFFKDKGMFFASLITPIILLVLYTTFLGDVYKDSFEMSFSSFATNIKLPETLIDGTVGGELLSSLLAVCCITVAFCSNFLMVSDKVTGSRNDLTVSPIKSSTLSISYYIATVLVTLIVCVIAAIACFIYLSLVGWYLSVLDIILIFIDVFILVMFGTALSSIINIFLSTQGQISAIGTIVSAGYGFICGAYMPISQFGEGLQKVLSFLPGTYGTSLIRNHALNGCFKEMTDLGFPDKVLDGIKDSIDCNIYFFDNKVSVSSMYIFLISTVAALILIYILLNIIKGKKANKK